MFSKETVLVLGAGASFHYGYPLGEGLIDRIINTIKTKDIYDRGRGRQIPLGNYPEYKKLREHLEFYDPLSIDSFLSLYSERIIRDAGKTMIAYEILQSEKQNLFKRMPPVINGKEVEKNNWYRFLFNALISGATPQRLIEDDLRLHIITFNYDISLEYGLYSRFHNSPFLADKAPHFLQKVSDNIIHIYGQVGKFHWKGQDGDRADDDYGSYQEDNAFTKAEQQWKDLIFVIGEERNGEVEKKAAIAKKWLEKAENIFFLGFGFNEDNLKLLNLKMSTLKAKRIYCTNYQNSQIINQQIENCFNRSKSATRVSINGKNEYVEPRQAVVSANTVYEALARDFSLI